MERLLTPKQLAELLQVSDKTVYFWAHTGFVPHIKLRKCVRFRESEIREWLKRRKRTGRKTLKYETSRF